MLTKAAKQGLKLYPIFPNTYGASYGSAKFPSEPVRNINNQEVYVVYMTGNFFSNGMGPITTSATGHGVHFGSGTTTPTENDYLLTNSLTSGYSAALNYTEMGLDQQNKPYALARYTITNNSSANITIAEIGMISNSFVVADNSSTTNVHGTDFLIDHTLLDTPVTIAPGETAPIEYVLSCDMSFT